MAIAVEKTYQKRFEKSSRKSYDNLTPKILDARVKIFP